MKIAKDLNRCKANLELSLPHLSEAEIAKDLDRCKANLELSLPHLSEAVRIYTTINHVASANRALCQVAKIEENLRQIENIRG